MDIDANHENAPTVPKPHVNLWFRNGDVLSADPFLFKVHKDVLSLQSSVFRDMFDLPVVDGSQLGGNSDGALPELYDGLPVVKLVGDKGEDVVHLLRAVYERQCVQFFLSFAGSPGPSDLHLPKDITVATTIVLLSIPFLRFCI